MKLTILLANCLSIALLSCNRIEGNNRFNQKDIEYLRTINLLDRDEQIYRFYSEYKKRVAGNFFTNKRIATYWIDERNQEKNEISFAFYTDIVHIDTVYYAGITHTPYMLIRKNDSTQFKVSVNGSKEEVKLFFEEAMKEWKKINE
ncbi:MAG: hypothetical protein KIS77_05060 [Saprospiraceae bacterium]|nr:hypothetical protein [Saprospiraceae bacterium]